MAKKKTNTNTEQIIVDDEEPITESLSQPQTKKVKLTDLTKAQLINLCVQLQEELMHNNEFIDKANEFSEKWNQLVSDFNIINGQLKGTQDNLTAVVAERDELIIKVTQVNEQVQNLGDELNCERDKSKTLFETVTSLRMSLDACNEINDALNRDKETIQKEFDFFKLIFAKDIIANQNK